MLQPLLSIAAIRWFFFILVEMGHLKVNYREGDRPRPSEDASLHSVAWVAVPIMTALVIIIVLLLINQKKQWIPVPCYRTPTKV